MSSNNHYKIVLEDDANPELVGLLHWKLNSVFKGHVERVEEGFIARDAPDPDMGYEDGPRQNIRSIESEMTELIYSWLDSQWLCDRMKNVSNRQRSDSRHIDLVSEIFRKSEDDTGCDISLYHHYTGSEWSDELIGRNDIPYRSFSSFDI